MKIYDEITKEEIHDPDLSAGYLYEGVIATGRTEERYEVMEGTVTESRPEGLMRFVPAQDIMESCMWYHKFTDEELNKQDMEKRIAALEEELAAAKILLGVE